MEISGEEPPNEFDAYLSNSEGLFRLDDMYVFRSEKWLNLNSENSKSKSNSLLRLLFLLPFVYIYIYAIVFTINAEIQLL